MACLGEPWRIGNCGDISLIEHDDLGRWIARSRGACFLYGRDTRHVQKGLYTQACPGVVERHRKKRYLIHALKQSLGATPKPAILFKAIASFVNWSR